MASAMIRSRRLFLFTLAVVGILAVGIAAGSYGSQEIRELLSTPSSKKTDVEKPPEGPGDVIKLSAMKQATAGIEIVAVEAKPLMTTVWRSGRVALNEDRVAHISPPTDGILVEVSSKLGQQVRVGETLAVLDSREFGLAKFEAYRAKLALVAERELSTRTRTTMSNAAEMLSLLDAQKSLPDIEKQLADKPIGDIRQQLLTAYVRRNQLRSQVAAQASSTGAVSEAMLTKTKAEEEAASAGYTALVEELRFQVKNQVRQAELKLKDAETNYDVAKAKLALYGLTASQIEELQPILEGPKVSHLAIMAPFDAVIVEKHAVLTQRVNPQQQLFILADLATVWVQADIFETDLALVRDRLDAAVLFRSSLVNVSMQKASVVYAGDVFDKSTRAITFTAVASNPDRLLKPGMFIEVGFETGDRTPVFQLTSTCILRYENKPFVFIHDGGESFRRVDVTLGRTVGESVEITAGLKAGDKVVAKGGFVLKSELLKDQMVGE
jgi:membrane fusion protein, heavy metal efflux system